MASSPDVPADVTARDRPGAATAAPARKPKYLTRTRDRWRFQMRLPVSQLSDYRRALKRFAADGDTSVQKLMEEALADLFVKYRPTFTKAAEKGRRLNRGRLARG